MNTDTRPQNLADIEDAEAVRWLSDKLAPARERALETPNPETVARLRARILGETAPRKHERIAA